jgi:hypothetical protein
VLDAAVARQDAGDESTEGIGDLIALQVFREAHVVA